MPTININTLPAISQSLGLHRNSLGVLFGRIDERKGSRPQPVGHYGANGGVAVYDVDEVTAWYAARTLEPTPKRGPDKGPRKKRSTA